MTKNKFFVALLFFLSLSVLVLAQDMKPDAGKLYNEGNALLKNGDADGAVKKYDAALNIEKDYRIYYQKGIALKKLGKLEDAKNSFEECIKLNKEFEGALNALGAVYFGMGNYQAAIDNFNKILNSSANNGVKSKVKKNISLAYAKLGNDALSGGSAEKGIEYLKKSVENDNYDAAYLSLAKVYSELGKWDESIDAAQNALKYRSKISRGGPYFYMGISYRGKGDIAKAKEMFKQAASDPTYKKTAEYELSQTK
jgi:tetratricopeptide (TPR) repeat protein